MNRRVVITGMGVVCPLATDVRSYWDGLLAGKSGIAPIEQIDASAFKVRIGGEVKHWQPEKHLDARAAHRLDRYAQFAMVAGAEAVRDSGIDFSREDPTRAGAIVGSNHSPVGHCHRRDLALPEAVGQGLLGQVL